MFKSVVALAVIASASAFVPNTPSFGVTQRTVVAAEEAWTPADGSDWKETDFEADIAKLEAESMEKLNAKIKELELNIESSGK